MWPFATSTAAICLLRVKNGLVYSIRCKRCRKNAYPAASDLPTSLKQGPHLLVVQSISKVLDVDICELLGSIAHHVNALATSHETTDKPSATIHNSDSAAK